MLVVEVVTTGTVVVEVVVGGLLLLPPQAFKSITVRKRMDNKSNFFIFPLKSFVGKCFFHKYQAIYLVFQAVLV